MKVLLWTGSVYYDLIHMRISAWPLKRYLSLSLPEQLLLLLQGVEQVDGGGLLQAVGLEGRQHVDKLQEDLPDAHRQQVLVTLPPRTHRVQYVMHMTSWSHTSVPLNGRSCYMASMLYNVYAVCLCVHAMCVSICLCMLCACLYVCACYVRVYVCVCYVYVFVCVSMYVRLCVSFYV